jgi:predicted TIM-barrel fold metal-dependent hydrolase
MTGPAVIDSHFHLWELGHGHYKWLEGGVAKTHFGDTSQLQHDYRASDYAADARAISLSGCVHVEAGWMGPDATAETRFLAAEAKMRGRPFTAVVRAELDSSDIETILDRHQAFGFVRGVRMLLKTPSELARDPNARAELLQNREWRRGFSLLARRGLSFDLQATPSLLHEAAQLARDFPETAIALTHCGLPLDRSADTWAQWRTGIADLSRSPNVVAKISGLGMLDRTLSRGALQPIVHHVPDCFGPHRCMFGSNFPVDRLFTSLPELVRLTVEIVSAWDPSSVDAVMRQTACRFYRFDAA